MLLLLFFYSVCESMRFISQLWCIWFTVHRITMSNHRFFRLNSKSYKSTFLFVQSGQSSENLRQICDNKPTNKNNGSFVKLCHFISFHFTYIYIRQQVNVMPMIGSRGVRSLLNSPLTNREEKKSIYLFRLYEPCNLNGPSNCTGSKSQYEFSPPVKRSPWICSHWFTSLSFDLIFFFYWCYRDICSNITFLWVFTVLWKHSRKINSEKIETREYTQSRNSLRKFQLKYTDQNKHRHLSLLRETIAIPKNIAKCYTPIFIRNYFFCGFFEVPRNGLSVMFSAFLY